MASPLKPHLTNRSALDDAKAMPPPPAPVRQTLIMEPEIDGLADSLQVRVNVDYVLARPYDRWHRMQS